MRSWSLTEALASRLAPSLFANLHAWTSVYLRRKQLVGYHNLEAVYACSACTTYCNSDDRTVPRDPRPSAGSACMSSIMPSGALSTDCSLTSGAGQEAARWYSFRACMHAEAFAHQNPGSLQHSSLPGSTSSLVELQASPCSC